MEPKQYGELISMDKKYETRNGKPVRILCVDGDLDGYSVVGLVDGWPETWTRFGSYDISRDTAGHDLVEAKREQTLFLNVYGDGGAARRGDANKHVHSGRIACVKVTFKEGDGL